LYKFNEPGGALKVFKNFDIGSGSPLSSPPAELLIAEVPLAGGLQLVIAKIMAAQTKLNFKKILRSKT
jgi:hypothetical protein